MGKLVLYMPDGSVHDILLDKERLSIGRRGDNDICLPYPAVSGEHAVVTTILADSFLEDLGSTNGTLVNGQPVTKHFLRDKDLIDVGRQRLLYFASNHAVAEPLAPDVLRRDVLALHEQVERARKPPEAPKKPLLAPGAGRGYGSADGLSPDDDLMAEIEAAAALPGTPAAHRPPMATVELMAARAEAAGRAGKGAGSVHRGPETPAGADARRDSVAPPKVIAPVVGNGTSTAASRLAATWTEVDMGDTQREGLPTGDAASVAAWPAAESPAPAAASPAAASPAGSVVAAMATFQTNQAQAGRKAANVVASLPPVATSHSPEVPAVDPAAGAPAPAHPADAPPIAQPADLPLNAQPAQTPAMSQPAATPSPVRLADAPAPPPETAVYRVRVLTGANTGRAMPITRDEFSVGQVGVQVARIARRDQSWRLAAIEGRDPIELNGEPVPIGGVDLAPGDRFEVAGVQIAFERL